MKHYGDITQLSGYDLPVVDVIVGGSRCQDLSVAGKRAGLDGERSGLFMEQIRLVKEMREKDARTGRTDYMVRPRYLVWENVPGAFSSNGGEDFRIVLEEICKVADKDASVPRPPQKWSNAGCIMGDGWSIAWRVHNAQFWGVAQRRRRISLIADFGGLSAPEILYERKGMSRDSEQGRAERETAAGGTEKSADDAGVLAFDTTQVTSDKNWSHPKVGDPCHPLAAGAHPPSVTYQNTTGCLSQGAHPGSYNGQDAYNDMLVTCFQNTGQGWWNESQSAATVRTPSGGDSTKANLIAAVDCRNGCESEINAALQSSACHNLNSNNVCREGAAVRRLTPLECERLQGMPDNWSKYGINEKGEVYELSDSARYRLQGNGIATPFWRWLMKRISAQYERTPTLGSLFDGQGSFPMIWEGINGKGSALWASEIEKHAIAVTKYHFPEEE